ncbi:MAG: homoserine dehydrogenase [Candidatus Schekmanbacteria bacterium]|nr:homoserine dehydrogenase [Candidatus Schekmanbacteria bacterium]
MRKIYAGLIGFGTVGKGVVKILKQNHDIIEKKLGAELVLKRIADLDIKSSRGIDIDKSMLTANAKELIEDPEIEIIVELIGGINPAKEFILGALGNGKHVATANKSLLAKHGVEIFGAAVKAGKNIGFEASVGGVIPVIRSLKEGFAADEVQSIYGIINGTSNYILTKMTEEGKDFPSALKEAQDKGFAEADPTLDIGGGDSAHKIAVLGALAFGTNIPLEEIHTEGITDISPLDIKYAYDLGYKVKLLAIAKNIDGEIDIRVNPTMIPFDNPLSNVNNEYNAIYIVGKNSGRTILFGKGAGELPTAVAVVGDMIEIARDILSGAQSRISPLSFKLNNISRKKIKPVDEITSRFYFRFSVVDMPGVLSKISGILGDNGISISTVIQKNKATDGKVSVVIMTHDAIEKAVRKSLQEIDRLPIVLDSTVSIRVEAE